MKKIIALVILLSTLLSACLPAAFQPQAANPTPVSEVVLQATAAILAQQTIQALPTNTALPSNTPVVTTPTNTPTQATATETQNPILLTLTATLGTGTVAPGTFVAGVSTATTGVGTLQASNTPNPLTPSTTPHPQFYGTLPPAVPYNYIVLTNKAEVEVYISLRCETPSGSVTILEYPVKKLIEVEAPVGQYTYVAWVGGRQFTGAFALSKDKAIKIDFFKSRVAIK